MRFSASKQSHVEAWRSQWKVAIRPTFALALALAFALASGVGVRRVASAQPPGTDPPAAVFTPPAATGEQGAADDLPIQAFMFLSESKSPVMMPGMTWKELERLQNLDVGTEIPSQMYSFNSLDISGTSADTRAELEVTLQLSIESTNNQWIAIPLRMGNFHQLAPPDVLGVEEYFMTLAREGGGYLLWVKTTNRRDATLRMNVSARVATSSTHSLDFQLPDVPASARLIVDETNVTGDVIGRGYETLEPKKITGGRTEFVVESGGGTFTLRWGRMEQKSDDAPLLEVTSRVNVTWESPQDAPRAVVQLTLRNVRDSIDEFEIRLPTGSIVPENASLGAGGQSVTFGPPIPDPGGERRRVLIPEEEQQQRIDLNFSFNAQLPSGNISSANPLAFRVPEVVGTLRHRGEITIQTSDDYRLRWNAEPWVRSVVGDASAETTPGRSYLFQFDRGSFELPLWLSAKERQVRINASSRISFRETTATLEMLIRSSARAADGRGPQIDMADWRLQLIENAETNEPMDSFQGEGYPEIDFPSGVGPPPAIRILAQLSIDPAKEPIEIKVPRIVKTDSGLLVPNSTVDVINTGRSLLVVDLEASKNLERVVSSANDPISNSAISRFRVDSHDAPAVLVGKMIDQPPRITLASDGTIVLDGNELQTTIDWTVSSRLNLEGRLPIRIPRIKPAVTQDDNLLMRPREAEQVSPLSPDSLENWSVAVNGAPAILEPMGDDRFELVSDYLLDGTMSIRWHRAQKISPTTIGDSIESLALPRPAIEDVTVNGEIRILLKGSHQTELLSATTSASELLLLSLPPEPVRLRLTSRETPREELSVNQAVLRTAIGKNTRHEQVLASIQGGESFKVGLPGGATEVSVEAYIDGKKTLQFRRDRDTLVLSLPGDQSSHVIDLRVWIAEPSPSSTATIEPMLRLPIGVGRVYWQIIAPLDSHILWASPTIGRSMTWNFYRWKLGRVPSHDDRALTAMMGALPHPMPPGNRYLYVGSDVRSFQAVVVSRVVLWMIVGSLVLVISVVLTQFPKTRHPLTAVAGAVFFAGLLAIAPDAAVLAGQFAIIALVLVIVMIAVRSLVTPQQSDRIFTSRDAQRRADASTETLSPPPALERVSSITQTQALPPSPTEASP